MSSAVLQIGPADAVTPFEVAGLTEEEARAYFVRLRFARWNGQPACERCNCTAVCEIKTRRIFKCKMCHRQFSVTSNTTWHARKLSFRKLLTLIAEFAHHRQAKTTIELCRNLRVQYKTALLWVHKIRNELAERAKGILLSGEVEIDGSYYGGFIRPKNMKKERDDHRKVPYRANARSLCVVAARQRDGSIRTWIAKSEGDARSFIKDALLSGTVLFSDQAPDWSWLRGRHRLFTVNHKVSYYTPEACTNQVENYFRALRIMERLHRHISHNYLDLYAADAAWRIERNKWSDAAGLADVMAIMSEPGRSSLAGYFQGRKRSLSLCQKDGTTKAWRPPTAAERQRRKEAAAAAGAVDEFGASRKPASRQTWNTGYSYLPAAEIMDNPDRLPSGGGVYTLCILNSSEVWDAAGFRSNHGPAMWKNEDWEQAYCGETYHLRTRLAAHLIGGADESFRHTLLAIQHATGALGPDVVISNDRQATEASLTAWLRQRLVVGFKHCGYIKQEETAVLQNAASPLNITRDQPGEFAAVLRQMRAQFRAQVSSAWPSVTPGWRPQRR